MTTEDYFGLSCRFSAYKVPKLGHSKCVFIGATSLITNNHFMLGFTFSRTGFSLIFKTPLDYSVCSRMRLFDSTLVFLNSGGVVCRIMLIKAAQRDKKRELFKFRTKEARRLMLEGKSEL